MTDKQSDKFYIKDLVSATYIMYNGVKFADGYDESSGCWVFEDPETCKKLDLQLRNGDAQVEILKYESARRTLLGMVRGRK